MNEFLGWSQMKMHINEMKFRKQSTQIEFDLKMMECAFGVLEKSIWCWRCRFRVDDIGHRLRYFTSFFALLPLSFSVWLSRNCSLNQRIHFSYFIIKSFVHAQYLRARGMENKWKPEHNNILWNWLNAYAPKMSDDFVLILLSVHNLYDADGNNEGNECSVYTWCSCSAN